MKPCSRCKENFECGAQTPAQQCWCFDLPALQIQNKQQDCFCPSCLKLLIEIQNEPDFYYNEAGLMVMTRAYLLRRGTCCKQNCLNCPY